MKTLKDRIWERRRGVALILGFMVGYMICFTWLENRTGVPIHLLEIRADDYIPFCEYFVVPYLLWFAYVPAVLGYLFFKDRRNYDRCAVFLCTGMLIFLVISTFIPNIQHLRLHTMPRHNVFTVLVSQLWQTDTPTNLFPSIHVYNSLGAHFAVMNNETLSGKKWVRRGSLILCVSIILSTMFIKQHSMFDVLMAFIMGAVMYAAVYYYDVVGAYRFQTGKRQRKRARIG